MPRDALRGNHGIRPRRVNNSSPVGAHLGIWRTSREYVGSSLLTGVWGAGDGAPKTGSVTPPLGQGGCIRPCSLHRLPGLLLRLGSARGSASLIRSAASFWSIICSQNEATASQDVALRVIALTTTGSARSAPMTMRDWRCDAHAGHCSKACCTVSSSAPHSWHWVLNSLPIRCRYRPKQPWPVRTCTYRNVREPWPRPTHSAKHGCIADMVKWPAIGDSSRSRHSLISTR
jgi:hypothetical protein